MRSEFLKKNRSAAITVARSIFISSGILVLWVGACAAADYWAGLSWDAPNGNTLLLTLLTFAFFLVAAFVPRDEPHPFLRTAILSVLCLSGLIFIPLTVVTPFYLHGCKAAVRKLNFNGVKRWAETQPLSPDPGQDMPDDVRRVISVKGKAPAIRFFRPLEGDGYYLKLTWAQGGFLPAYGIVLSNMDEQTLEERLFPRWTEPVSPGVWVCIN
ncbi:MAG TPA: hypothetical protein VGM54_07100 [Chthoniobacter sp.]